MGKVLYLSSSLQLVFVTFVLSYPLMSVTSIDVVQRNNVTSTKRFSNRRNHQYWLNSLKEVFWENNEHDNKTQNISSSTDLFRKVQDLLSNTNNSTFWRGFEKKRRRGENLMDMLPSSLFSSETAKAMRTIGRIIKRFPEHGIITNLTQYPPRSVVASMLALSRLQHASSYYNVNKNKYKTWIYSPFSTMAKKEKNDVDPALICDLAHYAKFMIASYGWKGAFFMGLKLHAGGNLEALLAKTGVHQEDVVAMHWTSQIHRPAYFIVRDVSRKKIVLCIRGTLSARDVLTDLCCTAEDFFPFDKNKKDPRDIKESMYRAHHGMLEAARGVANMTQQIISSELVEHPDFELVLVGHSLGGGVASILGSLWQTIFPGVLVYGFGSPCVGSQTTDFENCISVVGDGDPFSCLSLGHIADLTTSVSRLCEDEILRSEVLDRTRKRLRDMSLEDLRWCSQQMEQLRSCMKGEKLYPPGKILHMTLTEEGGGENPVSLKQVSQNRFCDLILHPRMFDLTRHVPTRYEAALQRLCT